MPPLYVQVRDDLAGIMFDVFGTQRSKQLLQRQRGRLGSLVEVVHVHCGPRNVGLLHYSAKSLGYDSRPITVSNFPARSGTNITGHLVIHPFCGNTVMAGPVTIDSVRAHGVGGRHSSSR